MRDHATRRWATTGRPIEVALPRTGLAFIAALTLAAGCGEDNVTAPVDPDPQNVPPELAAIDDRTITMNTLVDGSTVVDLEIEDPDDDRFGVIVTSDDESAIPGRTTECGTAPCTLTFAPPGNVRVDVTVTVTVTDSSGGAATQFFHVRTAPRLVTTNAGSGPGSLRRAIAEASPGDVIAFDTAGAFAEPRTITLGEQLVLDTVLTIEGTGTANLVLTGAAAVRVFKVVSGGRVHVSNLTIVSGRAPIDTVDTGRASVPARLGGCVYVGPDSHLQLTTVTVKDCTVEDDVGLAAGGGIAVLDGDLRTEGTRVEGNRAPTGGGIYASGGSVSMGESSSVASNMADENGGGIHVSGGGLLMEESSVVGNMAAESGGGVYVDDNGTAYFYGSTIEANEAALNGGGISVYVTERVDDEIIDLIFQDSRVADNTAAASGGGIYWFTLEGGAVHAYVENNSIVTGNSARRGGGIFGGAGRLAIWFSASIDHNTAITDGGGIHGSALAVEVTNGGSVSQNAAGRNGGGLHLRLGRFIYSIGSGCTVGYNLADADNDGVGAGGGIYDSGTSMASTNLDDVVCDNEPDDITAR